MADSNQSRGMKNRRRKAMEFDHGNFHFRERRVKFRKVAFSVLAYLAQTLAVAVLLYIPFSLFFSTDTERALKREIRMYERLYPDIPGKAELLRDGVANLQHKDNELYEQVFHANAPELDPMGRLSFLHASDTILDTRLASYTRYKADSLLGVSSRIESLFREIFAAVEDTSFVAPPMRMPLEDISYPQIGASVGSRIDPFYKAYVWHEGLDFIVQPGTPVYAAADGEVSRSANSKKFGNMVEIAHAGGYTTIYAHLESRSVRVGQKVKAGRQIGTVGMTGKAAAPHLHYEVRVNDGIVNPVDYLFGSVTAQDYANYLYMSVNTKQSMD